MRCRGSGRTLLTHPNSGKFIRKDKEGVASVIGTIMALLIFLAILSIFVNTWMPITLKEHESNHMNEVMNDFGTMKGSLDNMVIYTSLTGYPSFAVYQNIDLGAEGIPAFASATAGLLTLTPNGTENSRSYLNFTTSEGKKDLSGGGSIEFYAPNRYYVQQWIAYENGAIILKQEDGQIVRADPGITFTLESGTLNVNYYQMSFYGASTTAAGTESTGLSLEVVAVNQETYNPDSDDAIQFTFITNYGQAYYDYLNSTLSSMYGLGDDVSNGWVFNSTDSYYYHNSVYDSNEMIFWQMSYEYLEQYDCYAVSLTIKNMPDTVSSISYSHAYVNFEITS